MSKSETTLEYGTVRKLQDYVAQKVIDRGFDDETLQENLLLLTEEVGELVKACRKLTGMNLDTAKPADHNVGEEVADVINLVFAVGVRLGLDIEQEFFAKNAKVDERIYKRSSQQTK